MIARRRVCVRVRSKCRSRLNPLELILRRPLTSKEKEVRTNWLFASDSHEMWTRVVSLPLSYERFLFLRFLKHVACLSVKVAVVVAPLYDIFQPCLFASYPPFWRCGVRTAVVIEQKGIVLRSTKWLQVIFIFTDTEQRFTLALVQVVGG